MRKFKLQLHRNLPKPKSKQLQLKQIYDSSFIKSREQSLRQSIRKQVSPQPLTERKSGPRQLKYMEKSHRYQDYLLNQNRPRRYQKMEGKSFEETRIHQNYHITKRLSDRSPIIADSSEPVRKGFTNESLDMFKIRKKVRSKVDRRISISHSKIGNDNSSTFEEAKTLYKLQKFEQAIAILNELMQSCPQNLEYQYYAALCHLNKYNYHDGYKLLTGIIKADPQYKKNAYLFAAISAHKLQKYEQSYRFCNSGLELFRDCHDLLAYRAKLSEAKQDYNAVHRDYQRILNSDPTNIEILISNAQCLSQMKAYANCLSNLSAALSASEDLSQKQEILTKRISIYIQMNDMEGAKKDLSMLENQHSQEITSQVCFWKGYLLAKEGHCKQSILCYELAIKSNSSKQYTQKSLIEIVKSKIDSRDFYSAAYHINRSKTLDLEPDCAHPTISEIDIYKYFIEGVINLMKRKLREADASFEKLLSESPNLTKHLSQVFYLYRAYAKFCLSDYKQAIADYEFANKLCSLDLYAKYNKLLAQGIAEVLDHNYIFSFEYFNTAEKLVSHSSLNRIDTYLYRAALHVQKAKECLSSPTQAQQLKSLQQIFAALRELDKAYDLNSSNSNMLYYRSLIYLYLSKYDEALKDIIKAISKSQENVAKYFFFRGLVHASLGSYKQALNDYNICENLDSQFWPLYLERAKVHFLNRNVAKAENDLIKLKCLQPQEDIKYHQACLNYVYGHYSMASSYCADVNDKGRAKEIKIMAKLKLGKIDEILHEIEEEHEADRYICDILRQHPSIFAAGITSRKQPSSSTLKYFSLYHYHHYLGVRQFILGNYNQASHLFATAIKQRNLYDLQNGNDFNDQLSSGEDSDEEQSQGDSEKDTVHKMKFNIFICELLLQNYQKAYEIFIRDILGGKRSLLKNSFMASFSHALFQSAAQTDIEQSEAGKQIFQLMIFETKLDCLLGLIELELPNLLIKTRLCLLGISHPRMNRTYKPKADPEFILQYMSMSEIENKPEPPWVKRKEYGLIFTDETQNINIEFETTEQDEEDEGEDQSGESDEEEEDNNQDEESREGSQLLSVSKFKEKMKLGDSIERKLQLMMQKKSRNQDSQDE